MRHATLLASGILLSLASTTSMSAAPDPSNTCITVHGRHAIYANGDRLWVRGSKHLLEVTNDTLDKALEQRGWERTVAIGDFTVCTDVTKAASDQTIRDKVTLNNYSHIEFKKH